MKNLMRTATLLLTTVAVVLPASAQVPSTGDEAWKENFPLDISNVWQFEYEVSGQFMFTDVLAIEWRVTEERLLGDTLYYQIQVTCDTLQIASLNGGCEPGVTETVLVRYDDEKKTVMRRGGRRSDGCLDPFFSDEFPLDVATDSLVTSECGISHFWQVSDPVTIGSETYSLTGFSVSVESAIPQSYLFAHGVGPISFGGCEGGCWGHTLTYARVGEKSYGTYRRIPAGWQVTGTDPQALETAVSIDTVDFTFSAAVDAGTPLAFMVRPASARVDEVEISDDSRAARISTAHEADRDYTWVLSGARSQSGASLAVPHVLRYTTADANGTYTASGVVEVVVLLEATNRAPAPEEIIVALLTRPADPVLDAYTELTSDDVAAATRLEDENAYTWSIDGLRPGTYWPVALWDGDQDGNPDLVGGFEEWKAIEIINANISDVGLFVSVGGSTEQPFAAAGIAVGPPYPNPTDGSFAMAIEVEVPGHMTVAVYDVLGRRVGALQRGRLQHGRHEVSGDLSRLPAGVYFIRATTEVGQTIRPIVVQ